MNTIFDFKPIDELCAAGYYGPAALEYPEFYWRSMLGALVACRDAAFRPLGEEIAPPEAREGIDMEAARCEYRDSRFQHDLPMNLSALRQTADYWPQVTPTIAAIREGYCAHRGRSGPVTMIDLWLISKLCQLLPAYLLRRRHNRIDAQSVPIVPAIIYRIALGMHRIVHISLIQQMAAGDPLTAACLSAEKYYPVAEAAGLLIGRISVCAGPPQLVDDAYRAMIGPSPAEGAESCAQEAGFYRYAALFMKLELEKYVFAVHAAVQLRELIEQLHVSAGNERAHAFRAELERFEAWSAQHTSPLAHEIASEDVTMLLQGDQPAIEAARKCPAGSVRQRMLDGLTRLQDAADQFCQSCLGAQAAAWQREIDALDPPDVIAGQKTAADFVAHGLDEESAQLAAATLVAYRRSEWRALRIFELLQARLNGVLGDDDSRPVWSSHDIALAFGPRIDSSYARFFEMSLMD